MKYKCLLILSAAVSIVFAAVSCATTGNDASGELRVGVIMPLTGAYAVYGKAVVQGMELYQEKLEAEHSGKRLKLIVVDNASTPEGSVAAYERLVKKEKVPVIVGAYTSANTFPLKPLVKRYQVPVVTPTATHDEITVRNPLMFRTCFDDSFQGNALGQYAWEKAGFRKIGVMWCLNVNDGDYSRDLARSVMDAFRNCGGKVMTVGYNIGQKNFSAQVKELKEAGVDAVFAPLYPTDLVPFAIEAAKEGVKVFGCDSWSGDGLVKKLGEAGNDCFYSCMYSRQYQNDNTTWFVNTAQSRGINPGLCMAQGFDTAGILCSVMTSASTSAEIAEAMFNVHEYPGVTGPTSIFKNGRCAKNVFIVRIVWDKFNKRAVKTLEYTIEPLMK